MSRIKTLYVTNRKEWRKWLEKNFDKERDIWLIYPKKSSGKKRIIYNDAVEEALCFGWIDSTVKSFDEDHSIQRFSPRNPKSSYSQLNKERIKWTLEQNMIHPSILETARQIASEKFVFPKDILDALKKDNTVWKNFSAFSDTYKRIRIAYIDSARERPEEFRKRLNNFTNKTRENKKIGFGGIEKYY
ncbi:MAG: YdeI/OmpD-associated family protein [Candidatus Diapherotrites archaeon]|nr:YdeI/OmpD-associated family protein [Candidatus Diapherotrites archaeon]